MVKLEKVVYWFLISLFVHSILILFTGIGYVQPDSPLYMLSAKSLTTFSPDNFFWTRPMYPLFISLWAMLGEGVIGYINAFMMSLLVFPAYLISQYTKDKTNQFLIMLFSILLPSVLFYPTLVMAENLFIPLFMLGFVLLIRWWTDQSNINLGLFILVSLFATLTKVMGATLFLTFIILIFLGIINKKTVNMKMVLIGLIALLILLTVIFFRNTPNINPENLMKIIPYLTIGTFGLVFLLPNKTILKPYLILLIVYILISSSSSHLRYLDPLVILIILLSFTGEMKTKWYILLVAVLIVLALFDNIIPIRGWGLLHLSTAHIILIHWMMGDITRFISLIFLFPLATSFVNNKSIIFFALFFALFFMIGGYILGVSSQFLTDECSKLMIYLDTWYPDYNYIFPDNTHCTPWITLNHENVYDKTLTITYKLPVHCSNGVKVVGYSVCKQE